MTTVSTPLAALHLADGPAMYFGGTIMTFALPLGAFIVITLVLYYLFRSAHSGPKLKYLTTAPFASVGTREPGQAQSPEAVAAAHVAVAEAAADPESPIVTASTADAATMAAPQTIVVPEAPAAPEATAGPVTTEGKDGGE
jgi:hypothetical protein